MSLHGIGESFFEMYFRRLLEKHGVNYIPPNVIRGVDYLLTAGELVFLELEDTVDEIYSAAAHMELAYRIASLYNGYVVIAVPVPENLSSIRSPLAYFLRISRKYHVRRELWLVLHDGRIIKIYESKNRPSSVLSEISVTVPVRTVDGLMTVAESRRLVDRLREVLSSLR